MRGIVSPIRKILVALLVLSVIMIASVAVAVNVSPKPFASLVRRQFSGGVGGNIKPAIYQELSPKVQIKRDIEYPSRFKSNRLDVFSPKDASAPLPTVIWTHGGGFVGGDKADIETWATLIAANGYTVVSINYELAPHRNYPGPIIQLGEVYEFLKHEQQRFPTVDLHRLIFGGDSAGAQVASQFTALQTNLQLAKSMQMTAVVPKEDLLAVVLYCGPYDLKGLYDGGSWFGRFFIRQMGWAYFGIRDWRDTTQAAQAATIQQVTKDFPPTFITDGNQGSFEADARKLEAAIKEKGAYVDSLYYPAERVKLGHEYQFDFSLPESIECLNRTLVFLSKVTRPKERKQ